MAQLVYPCSSLKTKRENVLWREVRREAETLMLSSSDLKALVNKRMMIINFH